jgi:uncharacterized membrane protein YccC
MVRFIQQFTWRSSLFAVKTFTAAMVALFIAFRLDLAQPGWAVTTVYIVSQPFAGMVLAKSLYRVVGTVIGAAVSLVFVALFSNTPELFCLALALWIGAGTAVSIYLRDAPHAYVGMLSGYSAAIIGLPAALAPTTAFDFAVSRCLEIMLGIACGTLMHHVVFPQRAGDSFRKALDATLPNMARWAGDALRGEENEANGLADRRKIISAVVALDSLRVFAAFDTPAIWAIDAVTRQFEGKLLSLLALLVSAYDRFALLRVVRPATADALRPLLERAAIHIARSATAATPGQAREETAEEVGLLKEIEAQIPLHSALRTDPDAFLVRSILLRLRDVLGMWRDAVWIRTHIAAGRHPPDAANTPAFHPYRDVTLALVGAAVSAAAVLIASAFWIFTAWPNGPTAVTFAGIMCAIMGARDNPVSSSIGFLRMSIVGSVIAAVYVFVVLPTLSTFSALVMALAPFYLACGLFMTAPSTLPFAMPLIFVSGGLIGLANTMSYDFAVFTNNAIGYVVGIGIGAAALALLRPLGAEWTVRRLTRGLMADLAEVAGSASPQPRSAFESRMFDRINALFMRLDPMVDQQRSTLQGSLAGLRVGLNLLLLRILLPSLKPAAAPSIEIALAALADHFRRMARGRKAVAPLTLIEAARDQILALDEDAALTRVAESLYNIEVTLRQHSLFFERRERAAPGEVSRKPVAA